MKPLRVVHCPVNMGSIGWTNVQALRRKGVDARLVLFEPRKLRPYEVDVTLDLPPIPDGNGRPTWVHPAFWQRQAKQFAALARFLPTTDVFHFYFGLTLVPKAVQFPALRAFGRKSVFHFLGSDIRRKTLEELAYAWRADARIVGSFDAKRWVPDAHVVPVGIDLARYEPVPARETERVRIVHAPTNRRAKATDAVIAACEELPVDLDIVENVRHDQALERFREADIFVDQFNAGWHGVFAIEGMAMGSRRRLHPRRAPPPDRGGVRRGAPDLERDEGDARRTRAVDRVGGGAAATRDRRPSVRRAGARRRQGRGPVARHLRIPLTLLWPPMEQVVQKLATKVKPLVPLQVKRTVKRRPRALLALLRSRVAPARSATSRSGTCTARGARVPAGAGTAARALPARRGCSSSAAACISSAISSPATTTVSTRTRRCSKPHAELELKRYGVEDKNPTLVPMDDFDFAPRSDVRLHVGAVGLHPPPAEQHHSAPSSTPSRR